MENNIIYNDNNIFTINPHIYLNLNTTVTKNLEIYNNTNTKNFLVSNHTILRKKVLSDNIENTNDVLIHNNLNVNNTSIFKKNVFVDSLDNSFNINTGALVIKGGISIHKNTIIGNNLIVNNNTLIEKNVFIKKQLDVSEKTTLESLIVKNNTNMLSNLNIYENLHVTKNSNISNHLIVKKNAIIEKDTYIQNKLYVSNDSSFYSNLTIYGNLDVLGSKMNIISEKTVIGDPLIIFGMNQSKTNDSHYGGFMINHTNYYSGLLRKPRTNDFYLYKNVPINNSQEPNITNLNKHTNYSNLYLDTLHSYNIYNDILHSKQIYSDFSTTKISIFKEKSFALKGIKGDLYGNSTTATTADTILVNNKNSNEIHHINFVKKVNNIGHNINTSEHLKYIPSSGILYSNQFITNNNSSTNKFIGNLNGTILQENQPFITDVGVLNNLNVHNKIKTNNLEVLNDASIANDLRISGNLFVTGNHVFFVTRHFDITDPIFTVSNNSNTHDKGFLVETGIKKDSKSIFSGLIRKNNSNFYLVDNVTNAFSTSINTEKKSALFVNNINTDNSSYLQGATFLHNNKIVAFIPNNSNENILFNNPSLFNKKINIESNVELNGNMNISNTLKLLNTHSFISNGSTQLLGNTVITGSLDIRKSVISCDHIHIRSFLNCMNSFRAKNINSDSLKIVDSIIIPVRETTPSVQGSIFFNKKKQIFEGYNGNVWLPLGLSLQDDTVINSNLNVTLSLDALNITSRNDLFVARNANIPVLHSDSMYVKNNVNITNYLQTATCKVLNVFNVPALNTSNANTKGGIYFNKEENLFYGHNNQQWLPLGGINPYKDTTIDHNLNVLKKITSNSITTNNIITQNLNTTYGNITNINNNEITSNKIINNEITSNSNTIHNNLILPIHSLNGANSSKLKSIVGSIYFNTSSNLYYGHTNDSWLPLGGINPYSDTTINNNLNVEKKTTVHNLKVNDSSEFTGAVNILNKLTTQELVIPNKIDSLSEGALYIDNTNKLLKLKYNDAENVIPFNNNPIVQLVFSTDMFQFYNVTYNQSVFGNRINGLNDPLFNTFSKYYTIQEHNFFEETILDNIEFYVTHSVSNSSLVALNITIELIRIRNTESSTVLTQQFNNTTAINIGQTSTYTLNFTGSNNTFIKNDKIKIKLTLNNEYNGHEIFVKLHGQSKIQPNVDKLHILDNTDVDGTNTPALLVNGGARFVGKISASNFSTFTGCHISKLLSTIIYDNNYTEYINSNYIFKQGLIVSVKEALDTHIDNSKFSVILSSKQSDSTVFGVINKNVHNDTYLINSLGEGALWVSNINGNIKNGDYIMSSNIPGYGCKQNDDILHSYTVAKCCSEINWNSINSYINYYNNTYKIAFIACTYHCG